MPVPCHPSSFWILEVSLYYDDECEGQRKNLQPNMHESTRASFPCGLCGENV
jgi:hypothetical protein